MSQDNAEQYECECLKCGHKFKSKTHCTDTKCPECGGETRRAERPGAGKENRNDDLDEIEMAKWDRKYINSLPNGSFAVIEPDYLSGKTDNKNARHLPYKDSKGKVDLPHLRNALARMNQIKPVTKSISTEALRAKAKKVLEAATKKHLPSRKNEKGQKMSEEFDLSMSTGKAGKFEFLDERSDDTKRVMRFELMDNKELYNGVRFTKEALQHQLDVFNENKFLVTHGMDHSGKVLDQLGKVFEMEMEEEGEFTTIFITSEHYLKTEAQKQATILFDQGLLDYISGGWRASIAYNEDTKEYEVYKPVAREVSSTPIPAKTNAKTIENVCMALQYDSPKKVNNDDKQDEIPKEEFEMPGEDEKPTETPDEGGKVEQSAEFVALQKQAEANALKLAEMQKSQDSSVRASLMKEAAELGLSEEEFKDMPNSTIQASLEVANKVKMSTLRNNVPGIPLGGEDGAEFDDESPEMQKFLMDNIYRVGQ